MKNDFSDGVQSMAGNCLAAVNLVKKGIWSMEDFEKWLRAVQNSDPFYVQEAMKMIEKVKDQP